MIRGFVFLFLSLLFFGCSDKINLQEYGTINAQRSKYIPSKREIHSKTKVLIRTINAPKSYYSKVATSRLQNILSDDKAVIILNRKYKSLRDEIKLYEQSVEVGEDLGEVNYIISGEITSVKVSEKYHPPSSWKDRHGKIHYEKAYYEYNAVAEGKLRITHIPSAQVTTIGLYGRASTTSNNRLSNLEELKVSAIKNAISNVANLLYNFFAPKGYVYEVKRKDDDIIIHTTLGYDDGIREGVIVLIYTKKEVKEPFSDKVNVIDKVIGTGEVSNLVEKDNSWIKVIKTTQPIKIGDFVKPDYTKGWFDKIYLKWFD